MIARKWLFLLSGHKREWLTLCTMSERRLYWKFHGLLIFIACVANAKCIYKILGGGRKYGNTFDYFAWFVF